MTTIPSKATIETVVLPYLPPAIRWLPGHLAACLEGREGHEELRIEAILAALEDGEFPPAVEPTATHLRDAWERQQDVDVAITWLLIALTSEVADIAALAGDELVQGHRVLAVNEEPVLPPFTLLRHEADGSWTVADETGMVCPWRGVDETMRVVVVRPRTGWRFGDIWHATMLRAAQHMDGTDPETWQDRAAAWCDTDAVLEVLDGDGVVWCPDIPAPQWAHDEHRDQWLEWSRGCYGLAMATIAHGIAIDE